MAKNKISEYSATAANNTDVGGIDIAEGCAPSGINNAIRELMAQLKDQQTGTDADNFTVGGNLAVTGTTTATGTITATTVSPSANLAFTGTGNRITGDFSNNTLANRTSFQSSTTNGYTSVNAIPNGTSNNSSYVVYGLSSAVNTTYGMLQQEGTTTRIVNGKDGTGTYGNLEFWSNGSKQASCGATGGFSAVESIAIPTASPTGLASIELGAERTGDGLSYIDFHSSSGSDYDFRILRNGGVNTNTLFQNAGTGGIVFSTNGTTRMTLDSTGIVGNLVGTASNSIGEGQTWQNMTSSRAFSTDYTNSTGRPIMFSVTNTASDAGVELYVGGVLVGQTGQVGGSGNDIHNMTAIVPTGATYRANAIRSAGTLYWAELR